MRTFLLTIVSIFALATFVQAEEEVIASPVSTIDIVGSKSIFNKAHVKRIIIEDGTTTIAFDEGYVLDEKFISVGEDHITITGTAHTDFITAVKAATKPLTAAENYVKAAKVAVVKEVVEKPIEEPVK